MMTWDCRKEEPGLAVPASEVLHRQDRTVELL
jgi:hypothetical protein